MVLLDGVKWAKLWVKKEILKQTASGFVCELAIYGQGEEEEEEEKEEPSTPQCTQSIERQRERERSA